MREEGRLLFDKERVCALLGSGWVVMGTVGFPSPFFLSLLSFFSSSSSDPLYVSQERQQFHELFHETRNVSSMQCLPAFPTTSVLCYVVLYACLSLVFLLV